MPAAEAYADSSFFVSLYRKDENQAAAERLVRGRSLPIGFSPLNRIEIRNALRNLCARHEITEQEKQIAFRQIEQDLDRGLLQHLPVNWTETFRQADRLSDQYATETGQRTIDLLHVAIALEAGVEEFFSFDGRQRRLAQRAGLKVKP